MRTGEERGGVERRGEERREESANSRAVREGERGAREKKQRDGGKDCAPD